MVGVPGVAVHGPPNQPRRQPLPAFARARPFVCDRASVVCVCVCLFVSLFVWCGQHWQPSSFHAVKCPHAPGICNNNNNKTTTKQQQNNSNNNTNTTTTTTTKRVPALRTGEWLHSQGEYHFLLFLPLLVIISARPISARTGWAAKAGASSVSRRARSLRRQSSRSNNTTTNKNKRTKQQH